MRISSFSFSNTMLSNLGRNNVQLNKIMTQIAEQKRITKPSDDPIASTQIAQLKREQAAISQYTTNIDRLSGNLAVQETQVSAVSDQLLAILDRLREANNSDLGPSDMQGYATDMRSGMESLVGLLNTQDESGRYLFSGTLTNEKPVTQDANGNWVFNGNSETTSTLVGSGILEESNIDLVSIMGGGLDVLNDMEALLVKMDDASVDPASYLNEISTMIGKMGKAHSNSGALLTELGGRQNHIKLMSNTHADNKMINETLIGGLQGLDMAEAYTQLSNYTVASQASYQSYMQIANLSLFNLR